MRKLHEPLTLPKYPKLLEEINNMSMRIKIWKINRQELTEEQFEKLKSHLSDTDWKEVQDLLMRAYRAINEQREDPRKY